MILGDSIDFGHFSVWDYLPLIQKDSATHINGLVVYVKEGLPFAMELSLENPTDYYLFPTSFTSSSVLLVFPVSITVSSWGLDHKDYLTYSWATDRYSEFCYNFSIQITLPQWLTFLHGSLTVTLTVLIVWISFFLLMLVFVLQCFSFKWAVS